MPRPPPTLPTEVCKRVLDYFEEGYDAEVLYDCCLVCRAWVPRSRLHLYSTVRLHPGNLADFVRCMTLHPLNGHIVRELWLSYTYTTQDHSTLPLVPLASQSKECDYEISSPDKRDAMEPETVDSETPRPDDQDAPQPETTSRCPFARKRRLLNESLLLGHMLLGSIFSGTLSPLNNTSFLSTYAVKLCWIFKLNRHPGGLFALDSNDPFNTILVLCYYDNFYRVSRWRSNPSQTATPTSSSIFPSLLFHTFPFRASPYASSSSSFSISPSPLNSNPARFQRSSRPYHNFFVYSRSSFYILTIVPRLRRFYFAFQVTSSPKLSLTKRAYRPVDASCRSSVSFSDSSMLLILVL